MTVEGGGAGGDEWRGGGELRGRQGCGSARDLDQAILFETLDGVRLLLENDYY